VGSNVAGTPGGVATWGFVAAGTPGTSACGSYCIGSRVDLLPNFYATPDRDNRTTPTTLVNIQAAVQAAFVGFQLSSAPEDSELQPFPVGNGLHMTDVYMLALHEIGHAIGLGDSAVADSVLCNADPSSASLRCAYLTCPVSSDH
jgi:hypothetical protein